MSHPMTTTEKRAMKPSQRLKPLRDAYSREHDKYARGCAPAPNKEEMDAADRKASDALHTILDELDATTRRNSEACEIAMKYIARNRDKGNELLDGARGWCNRNIDKLSPKPEDSWPKHYAINRGAWKGCRAVLHKNGGTDVYNPDGKLYETHDRGLDVTRTEILAELHGWEPLKAPPAQGREEGWPKWFRRMGNIGKCDAVVRLDSDTFGHMFSEPNIRSTIVVLDRDDAVTRSIVDPVNPEYKSWGPWIPCSHEEAASLISTVKDKYPLKAPPCKPQSSSEQSASSSSSSGPSTATAPTSSPTEWGPDEVAAREWARQNLQCHNISGVSGLHGFVNIQVIGKSFTTVGGEASSIESTGRQSLAELFLAFHRSRTAEEVVRLNDEIQRLERAHDFEKLRAEQNFIRATKAESALAASRERCEKQEAVIRAEVDLRKDYLNGDKLIALAAAKLALSKLEVKRD